MVYYQTIISVVMSKAELSPPIDELLTRVEDVERKKEIIKYRNRGWPVYKIMNHIRPVSNGQRSKEKRALCQNE